MKPPSTKFARLVLRIALFAFSLLMFVNAAAFAQVLGQLTQQDPIGVPPNATTEGDSEVVVLSNGSLNMFIPVLSLPQRGGSSLTLGYTYNSNQISIEQDIGVMSTWDSVGGGYYDIIQYSVEPTSLLLFPDPRQINLPQLSASIEYVGDAPNERPEYNCAMGECIPVPVSCLMNWVFTDWSGTKHPFGVVTNCTSESMMPGVPQGLTPQGDSADGELLHLDTTNVTKTFTSTPQNVTVTTADGTVYTFSGVVAICPMAEAGAVCGGGGGGGIYYDQVASSIVDSNGNKITIQTNYSRPNAPPSSYTLTDTLGRVVTISPFSLPETITYKDSNGNPQTTSLAYLSSTQGGPYTQAFRI